MKGPRDLWLGIYACQTPDRWLDNSDGGGPVEYGLFLPALRGETRASHWGQYKGLTMMTLTHDMLRRRPKSAVHIIRKKLG